MTKRPSFQFYPADWRKDAELQSCSIGARGLWHEMLCIMHECAPYGELRVNGKPMSVAQLSRLVGMTEKDCAAAVQELESAGVPSRTEDGALYSRRMVRDEKQRDGWRGRQERSRASHDGVTPTVTPNVTDTVTHESQRSSSSTSSSPSEVSKPPPSPTGKTARSRSLLNGSEIHFEAFYKAFPIHRARRAAEKAFVSALKRAPPEQILEGAKRYAAESAGKEPKHIKHPATWLNADCWLDETGSEQLQTGFDPALLQKLNRRPDA